MIGPNSFSYADRQLSEQLSALKEKPAKKSLEALADHFTPEANLVAVHCGRARLSRFGPFEVIAIIIAIPIVFGIRMWLDEGSSGYYEEVSDLELMVNFAIIGFALFFIAWMARRKELTLLTPEGILVLSAVIPTEMNGHPRVAAFIDAGSIQSTSSGFMGRQVIRLSGNRKLTLSGNIIGQHWPEKLQSGEAFCQALGNKRQEK